MKAILAKSKYRNKLEIHKDILKFCLVPRVKTRIIFACTFTTTQTNTHLPELVKAGMLDEIAEGKRTGYQTTEKGKQYLASLNETTGFMP